MSFPQFKSKYERVALFSPSDYISYALEQGKISSESKFPETVVLCYHSPLMQKILKDFKYFLRILIMKILRFGFIDIMLHIKIIFC